MKCVIDGCNNDATVLFGWDPEDGSYCKEHYDLWVLEWDAMCDDLRKLTFQQIMQVFGVD